MSWLVDFRGEFLDFRSMFVDTMEFQRQYIDKRFDKVINLLTKHIGKNGYEHYKFEQRFEDMEDKKTIDI